MRSDLPQATVADLEQAGAALILERPEPGIDPATGNVTGDVVTRMRVPLAVLREWLKKEGA